MRTVAVVLAAGSGSRFGGSRPKQLEKLGGRSILEHSVVAFDRSPSIDEVLAVVPGYLVAETADDLISYRKVSGVIAGGAARTDSTKAAIGAIAATGITECKVLFHDAARPLVSQDAIARCAAALDSQQAAAVVVPSSDTIVEVTDGMLRRVLPRSELARAQTPQGFLFSVISRAYELATADPGFAQLAATDDCGVVLRYLPDVQIQAVPGSDRNIKITYPADLAVAEVLLSAEQQQAL
jgi:2-C-methyl-D-erythritol 4-phosphate cytidylyltransferase